MSLPNTDFTPPGLRIARVCKNCAFFSINTTKSKSNPLLGFCSLEQQKDANTKPRPIHGTCSCDVHVFKKVGVTIHAICEKYNLTPPNLYEI